MPSKPKEFKEGADVCKRKERVQVCTEEDKVKLRCTNGGGAGDSRCLRVEEVHAGVQELYRG